MCVENCPMWTSLKICSHYVAVAHSMGCTGDYVTWFPGNAKLPNITRLSMQVPQGVVKKPSHRHYSQRKNTSNTIARVANTSATVPAFATGSPYLLGQSGGCTMSKLKSAKEASLRVALPQKCIIVSTTHNKCISPTTSNNLGWHVSLPENASSLVWLASHWGSK